MAARNPAEIHNIALAGHGGCGKTTLTERLLLATGQINRMGSIEDRNTVSDWMDLEKSHQHSLASSVVHFEHDGCLVNLIDTPGMGDFLGQAIACFPAVETVAVVVDAIKGIETTTRRVMGVAQDRELPRLIIVNKIDAHDARAEQVVESLRLAFGSGCLPINLPTADGSGVVDVFEGREGGEPAFSSVEEAHTKILDQVVEVDDELMEQYLEGAENLDASKVHAAFERAMREGHLTPICFCSAKTGAGIEQLLHVLTSLLPSPPEGNPRTFILTEEDGTSDEVHATPDPDKPLIAHVIKIASDPFVGKVCVFRVHQGTIKAKTEVKISGGKKLRVGNLFRLLGKEQHECSEFGPGDIGAVAKLDDLQFNAVIQDASASADLGLKPLPLPTPLYGQAVELANHADETKFSAAVQKLSDEDPCFVMERIAATRQTVMRGLGELHLRVIFERLKDQFGIEVQTSQPKVAYKESITAKAEGHHRHKKQTGGAGQFGEVFLRVEPLPDDSEEVFEFHNDTFGGSIPRQFLPAIEKGIRRVLSEGAVAGYPMTRICVRVYDGKHHPVDSKEVAFMTAGKKAFIDAVQKARPVLLEPFVNLEVTFPAAQMGDITGDLSGKRGRVIDTDMIGSDLCIIRAQAPLGELQNYANELKSMTGGQGSYTMDYSHDEPCPPQIQAKVIAEYKPKGDED